ncbi:alpha/beta-hydrolase [Thozetella sp. PMI_491]|nr:alpha/beta-hydrolase [Thozetella sp. PMI_491]
MALRIVSGVICLGVVVGASFTDNESLEGGLTILAPNDLSNFPAPDSSAILSDWPVTYSSALKICHGIQEDLVSPATVGDALKASLKYQVYLGHYNEDQLFWISATPCGACRAVDATGKILMHDCTDHLPVLCTQSASVSNATFYNTGPPYQITQPLGRGQVTGYRDHYSWRFLGVRFAEQPVRFEYSTVYENVGNATALSWGNDCYQPGPGGQLASMSEDCLFANIWTPYLPGSASVCSSLTKLKPVVVWIHGGAFVTGTSSDATTDGANMASRGDVVVVAISYRLGNLGFLPFNDTVHNGNYAWVAKNIATFGGDANNVTIMGQSAGGSAVHTLMTSPPAKGLFRGAVAMSDTYGFNIDFLNYDRYLTPSSAYQKSTSVVLEKASCQDVADQIACLREIDPLTLVTNLTVNYAFPVQDGVYLNVSEYNFTDPDALSSDVTAMFGVTRDEDGILAPIPPENMTLETWMTSAFALAWLGVPVDLFPIAQQSGLDLPANATQDQIFNITVHILTNGIFTCLTQAKAYSASKHGSLAKVYNYSFNRTYNVPGGTNKYCSAPISDTRPYGDPDQSYYRCHAGEVVLIFGNMARKGMPDRDGLDTPFSQLVLDYWTSFARTLDPNPGQYYLETRGYSSTIQQTRSNPWTAVTPENLQVRQLQWNGFMTPFMEEKMCGNFGLGYDSLEGNPLL